MLHDDGFETYFAEKLWDMIPAVYRHEDGLAANPGVLRAMVDTIAAQFAVLRRSHDRLWDDQYIDLCSNWAVSYIGELVGTRLVSALNERGRRVDVAKTIYYRRRKGTLRVLEELISDIAGWEGKVVEEFRRLGRTRHGLDPKPGPLAGRFTGTLPGGWADLRRNCTGPPPAACEKAASRGSELVDGPFDEYYHTADMRRHRGVDGRYNIPKLAFHLFRLRAYPVSDVTPFDYGQGRYTFDPSGRDVQLFMPRNRPVDFDWDTWRSAEEWELPAPLRCRLLAQEMERLWPTALTVEGIEYGQVAAGCLADWSAEAPDMALIVDPKLGRFRLLSTSQDTPKVAYHYGFSGDIGAGTYARPYVEETTPERTFHHGDSLPLGQIGTLTTQIEDSATYPVVGNSTVVKGVVEIRSANRHRPYVRLGTTWFLAGSDGEAELVLDGLWIGGSGQVVLRGDYSKVTIRHCTLDPGGSRTADGSRPSLKPVPLVIKGHVDELAIDSSITGPIGTASAGVIERLVIRDSIVQSIRAAKPALKLESGEVQMQRVTIFGSVDIHRLWACEALLAGKVNVEDTQNGCFRFGAALGSATSTRLPKPYESHFVTDAGYFFTSRRFGDPGYAQLSEAVPEELRRGAENGSEIGAFSGLLNPVKEDSLKAKVEEYMPFGLIPIFIKET